MQNDADAPTNFGQMDFASKQFLLSKGLAHDKSIVACNPITQTVTFDDGRMRTATCIYSRVMGYHRPVDSWNAGKQSEHRERVPFRESGPLFTERWQEPK
jgi:hypothetical protein